MKHKVHRNFIRTGVLFVVFALFTAAVLNIDVKPIGPQQSSVGFATINGYVFDAIGENLLWDKITDFTVGVSILVAVCFVVLSIAQWITRKSIKRVNSGLLSLGVLYICVAVFYAVFELIAVNYRPVIVDSSLEASFPSTHTMIALCVMASAMMRFRSMLKNKTALTLTYVISVLIVAVTAIGRLIAGVHWFTDVAGGLLLGVALVSLYDSLVSYVDYRKKSGNF